MKSQNANSQLDKVLNNALLELDNHEPTSDEYAKIVDQAVKLHRMKEEETPSPVSKDTLALIAANLIGIALIITHEHTNVITSKAMSLAVKPK